MKPRMSILSFTLKELYDNRDGMFINHDKYVRELQSPVLLYAYANTLVFEIKSSRFGKTEKGGVNKTKYQIYVLFEDFYTIGKDKDIPFEDAVDFAINFGDVHIRCTCPANLYWGYAYIGTELGYIYGIPKERRYPNIRNPLTKGTVCKHGDAVIQWIIRNKNLIKDAFLRYYGNLRDKQSIYAVNGDGNTITIGHKNSEGDTFFEQKQELMKTEESEIKEPEDDSDDESQPSE